MSQAFILRPLARVVNRHDEERIPARLVSSWRGHWLPLQFCETWATKKMKPNIELHDTQFVLFGAGGDLSSRLIVPALFDLFRNGRLPERFLLLGVGRSDNDA